MNTKKNFVMLGILALVLVSLSLASAATLTMTSDFPTKVLPSATSFTVKYNSATLTGNPSFTTTTGTITSITNSTDASGITTVTFNFPAYQKTNLIGTLYDGTVGSANSKDFNVEVEQQFCEYGKKGTLKIANFDITNNGEGDDDNWNLLDAVAIEVEVENTDQDKSVSDIIVELKIADSDGNDVTSDFIDDEKIELGRIKSDESETATFEITEVPIDADEEDYTIYVKAYSDDEEDLQCIAEAEDFENYGDSIYSSTISVESQYEDGVIIGELHDAITASCGDSNVEIKLNVYNLGTDKEKRVLVNLYNKQLNINENVVIDNLQSMKKKEISFFFDVPSDIKVTIYNFEITTNYGWDEEGEDTDENSYDYNSVDDLDEDYVAKLEILSCTVPVPTVTAQLMSNAKISEELIVKVGVKNNENKANTFSVSADSFNTWATLVSVEPSSLSLGANANGEVIMKFMPTKSGANSFNIAVSGTGITSFKQLVNVNIEESTTNWFDKVLKGDSTYYVWAGVLGFLIVLLIILILVFAFRRKSKPAY